MKYTRSDSILILNSGINGIFEFKTNDASMKGTCYLYEVSGAEGKGLPQNLTGKIKLVVDQGLTYDIHTPFKKGPGSSERVFPAHLLITSSQQITSSEGKVSFVGGIFDVENFDLNPVLSVVVPAGRGEHKNLDDENSEDPTAGCDKCHSGWEIYRDSKDICTVHAYLLPFTYTFRGHIYFTSDHHNNIFLNLDHLSCDEPFVEHVNFEKNGCNLGFIGAVFGAIAGSITGGIGAGLGAIIGGIAGDSIEGAIKTKMLGEVANKINSESASFKLISF